MCEPGGYRRCAGAVEVFAAVGYDPERDVENPADSVFCAHGGGYSVPWDQVRAAAHLESGLALDTPEEEDPEEPAPRERRSYAGTLEQDEELRAIFVRT